MELGAKISSTNRETAILDRLINHESLTFFTLLLLPEKRQGLAHISAAQQNWLNFVASKVQDAGKTLIVHLPISKRSEVDTSYPFSRSDYLNYLDSLIELLKEIHPNYIIVANEVFDSSNSGFAESHYLYQRLGADWLLMTLERIRVLSSSKIGVSDYGIRNSQLWNQILKQAIELKASGLIDFVGFQYYHEFEPIWWKPQNILPQRFFTFGYKSQIKKIVEQLIAHEIEPMCSELAISAGKFQRQLYTHIIQQLDDIGVTKINLWAPCDDPGYDWANMGIKQNAGYFK